MERLRKLIKEVLSTPPKKDSCNCGCHSCENVGNPGVVLNESLVKKDILSENLRYHVDNKLPLTENTFRYGSEAFINLWAEARALYLREIIHVNDNDKEILEETDLGNYGMYEGKKVPLDLPMLEEEYDDLDDYDLPSPQEYPYTSKASEDLIDSIKADIIEDWELEEDELDWDYEFEIALDQEVENRLSKMKNLDLPLEEAIIKGDFIITNGNGSYLKTYRKGGIGSTWTKDKNEALIFGTKGSASNVIRMFAEKFQKKWNVEKIEQSIEEAAKKKPLNKPMRDSSGGKAYKVYVRDPKTKKIKTVRFGSGGLKAKINNPKARQAFAKRHNCAQKKDKTKASYWSCRLPRYAKLLGLKSSFSGFW